MKRIVIASLVIILIGTAIYLLTRPRSKSFVSGKNLRVAIVGNTFAERMQHYNYFETMLQAGYPGDSIVFRDFGWSGDDLSIQLRPLNFPSPEDQLRNFKPDVIIACYGMNESFNGSDSLASFRNNLLQFHRQFQAIASSPEIIFVSPIAHENMGSHFPNPEEHNRNLEQYAETMKRVSKESGAMYIDLFHPMLSMMKDSTRKLTINGIHLNDNGYRIAGELMASSLGLPVEKWSEKLQPLKQLVDHKNKQFFYRYRAVNAEYIYGRRKEPWVQPAGGPISYPTELSTLDRMVSSLDSVIWKFTQSDAPGLLADVKNIVERCTFRDSASTVPQDEKSLVLKNGFAANLFAAEKSFPVEKPVKITFDPQGRMWVASMASYPQYYPGCPPNDKIIILEDTNKDGRADRHTIFADSLYMPLSFELGYGGVFVSQPPDLIFLKDTNNDGRADTKDYLLHGFGTEDVHHSINAFTWGQDGALYMHSGTFLHSQIETPYGPVRNAYGETYRYEPRTMKLETYVSYPYANPWGNVFMRNGTHLIGDVSTGMNYYAAPLTTATTFPFKHVVMKDFLTDKQKPKTCGMEIVSSRHFPDDMQGNVLFNTFIGFQGVTNHKIYPKESGIEAIKQQPLLQSRDPNFRPVDLQFGPDGALYVADWYNPIINHGERALRDPLRDRTHGRIWRIYHKQKPLLKSSDLTKLSVPQLLDQLKAYEDRTRYRARIRLSELSADDVLKETGQWIDAIDSSNPESQLHQLEGLWIYQQFNRPNEPLLQNLLQSSNADVKAAAARVLFYWKDSFEWTFDSLIDLATDTSMKVRLQAIVALSHFRNPKAVDALLNASQLPKDDYVSYALTEAFKNLAVIWKKEFDSNKNYLANEPAKARALLSSLADEKKLKLPSFLEPDPQKSFYERRAISDNELNKWKNVNAVSNWMKQQRNQSDSTTTENGTGQIIHISTVPGRMAFDKTVIELTAGDSVTIIFSNADEMAHNIVFTKTGADEQVGKMADQMAQQPDGYEKNFIPKTSDILFYTPLVATGENFVLKIKSPQTSGDYPYICTFPGHWRVMRGILRVK